MTRRAEPSDHYAAARAPRTREGANVDGVRTVSQGKARPVAECLRCGWSRLEPDGRQWLALRAAARRHVGSTGHQVYASVRITFTYGPEPAP